MHTVTTWNRLPLRAINLRADVVNLLLARCHVHFVLRHVAGRVPVLFAEILQENIGLKQLVGYVVYREVLLPFQRII